MSALILGVILAILASAAPAAAFTCPIVIKQAEDLLRRAEASKATPETRPLIEEARTQLAEARRHHETAKARKDHADAVRKAKVAAAFAEQALVLAAP